MNIDFKSEIKKAIEKGKKQFKDGQIVIIDDIKNNYIYESLFSLSSYNFISDINSEYKIKGGVNFINKDLFYEREESFLEFTKNNGEEINLLIYGLSELVNDLYKEENNILKDLKKLHFKTILILNESERFDLEELLYHQQYSQKELNIKNFFVTKDMSINNRIINQLEDVTNYIYANIPKEYKKSFAIGQLVNDEMKNRYLYEELINIYDEILLSRGQEVLNKFTVVELYEISNLVKTEFEIFYNVEKDIKDLINIEKGIVENIIGKAFYLEVNDKVDSMEIIDTDEDNDVIKGFLADESFKSNNGNIELSECEKTAIMDFNEDEIMKYNLAKDFSCEKAEMVGSEEKEEIKPKRLSIINMSEDRTFKEVTISKEYGINGDFQFEESENFTPIQEIEEIDDKLKEVIWGNDEISIDELDDFELVEGSSKKYKKINMNSSFYN